MGADHHGTTTTHSVNAFTAVEQVRRMDPYGNPRGTPPATWPGQQGFVGGVEDPTGLIHIGARSYDPTTGRFISVDPILALGDNQQINGYAYANNNPITFTDPTGLCVITIRGIFSCSSLAERIRNTSGGASLGVAGTKAAAPRGTASGSSTGTTQQCLDMICRESFNQGRSNQSVKLDESLTIDCMRTGRQCELSPEAETLIDSLLQEMINYTQQLPPGPLEICNGIDGCSTLGPAQIAWCHIHLEMCALAMEAAVIARDTADHLREENPGFDLGEANAFRHAYWMSLMVAEYGISAHDALLLGVAHEMDGEGEIQWGTDESKIDLHNNFVGARVGVALRDGVSNGTQDPASLRIDMMMYIQLFAEGDICPSCLYSY